MMGISERTCTMLTLRDIQGLAQWFTVFVSRTFCVVVFVVVECDSVTCGGSTNMNRDDPQPTILQDENTPVVSVQPHCEVISNILTDKLFKMNKQHQEKVFRGMNNTIALGIVYYT